MEGFLILQLVCIFAPALLAGLVWIVISVASPGQKRLAIRFDLTTMMMLMTAIGVVLMLTKAAEKSFLRDYEMLMVCFVSAFTLPAIWLFQITLDGLRDDRRKREAQKTRTLDLQSMGPPEVEEDGQASEITRGEKI